MALSNLSGWNKKAEEVFSGINRSTLSAWEQGTWIPTRENYILLAEAFQKASGIKED